MSQRWDRREERLWREGKIERKERKAEEVISRKKDSLTQRIQIPPSLKLPFLLARWSITHPHRHTQSSTYVLRFAAIAHALPCSCSSISAFFPFPLSFFFFFTWKPEVSRWDVRLWSKPHKKGGKHTHTHRQMVAPRVQLFFFLFSPFSCFTITHWSSITFFLCSISRFKVVRELANVFDSHVQ